MLEITKKRVVLAVLAVCAIGFAGLFWPKERYTPEQLAIYTEYYASFVSEYRKTRTERDAHYYADYYADYFARYYTSEAYVQSLAYALPEATPEAFQYPQETAVSDLSLIPEGLSLIKSFEGLRTKPYKDVGGKLTIGYGHLLRRGELYTQISEVEAEALLRQDVALSEAIVKRSVLAPLNPEQFSALVSLVYNIGPGHFGESTLLKYLNDGDYARAAKEFLRWEYVNGEKIRGLTRRRKAEKILFEGGKV